ncbi:MAG: hypothetical protein V3T88_05515 [Nitrosomonadaceae bacterium]
MSDHIEGTVAKITSKEAGRNNNLVYNICIDDGQGDEWYGHGFDEPIFYEGDVIEFDVDWNGDYANIDTASVNVLEEGDGEAKPKPKPKARGGRGNNRSSKPASRSSKPAARKPAARGAAKSSGGGKADTMSKDEWADKDRMIRRQACMNTAINLVKLLNEAGVLPAIKKKSDSVDSIVALCDEEAERLYDQYEEQVYGKAPSKRGSSRGRADYDDDIPE